MSPFIPIIMSFSQITLRDELGKPVDARYRGPRVMTMNIDNVNVCIVNGLRRVIKANIPTVIIDRKSVKVNANMSPLNDDIIRDRLELTPIHLDDEQLKSWHDSGPYTFHIKMHNKTTTTVPVTSKSIQVYSIANRAIVSDKIRDELFPPSPVSGDHVVLAYLRPSPSNSEELDIEFNAIKGTGSKLHNPTSICSHVYRVDDALAAKQFEIDSKTAPGLEMSQFLTLAGKKCYKKDAYGDATEMEMTVHSETCLSPGFLVTSAFDYMIERVGDLPIRMKQGNNFEIKEIDAVNNAYRVTLGDENHTMGSLIQALLYGHWRNGDKVRSIGYNQPHPSEDIIVIKIQLARAGDDVSEVLLEGFAWVKEHLEGVKAAFVDAYAAAAAPAPAAAVKTEKVVKV